MKVRNIIAAVAIFSTSAAQAYDAADIEKICNSISSTSEEIFLAAQEGVDKDALSAVVIGGVQGKTLANAVARNAYAQYISQAYAMPTLATTDAQEQAAKAFSANAVETCMVTFSGQELAGE